MCRRYLWNYYIFALHSLSFSNGLTINLGEGRGYATFMEGIAMSAQISAHLMEPHADRAAFLSGLVDEIRVSKALTPGLFHAVIEAGCDRTCLSEPMGRSERIARLAKAEAWTDAVLALIDHELPSWKLRRLTYDSGLWHCALSRERELPEWLDGAIETSHSDPSLALLQGAVEVMRQAALPAGGLRVLPRRSLKPGELICCDNFS